MFNLQGIVLIISVVILGLGVLFGVIRKAKRTALRLATLLLSFGGAVLLAKLLGAGIGRSIVSVLQPLLGESVGELLAQEEMTAVADAICEMIATPILFLVLYLVLKLLTWIVYKILAAIFITDVSILRGRLTGALLGLLCGIIGLLAFLTPVFGYMTFADRVLDQVNTETQEEQTPASLVEQVVQTPVAKQTYQYVGSYVFRYMTTVDFEGNKINLEDETTAILNVLEDVKVLSESSSEEFNDQDVQTLQKMVEDVGGSKIVSTVVGVFLSDMSQSWLNGETALGMEKPDLGEDVAGITDAFLLVFTTSNASNITQDLGTFVDCFAILVESDLFVVGTDNAEFVNKLVSDGVVNRLYATLDANPRMDPVKTAIRDTGVRVMMDHLGAPETLREEHGELLENMADTLKNATAADGTVNREALAAGIHEVMTDYDLPVSEEASQLVAEAITEYVSADEIHSLTLVEIADKMAERFAAAGQAGQLPSMG